MAALAERVREALHIGAFEPTSLEAEHRMLSDSDDYAAHLKRLERAARQFQKDVGGFLDGTGKFLTGAPFPRLWIQTSSTQAAEPQRPSVPERHAHLFTAEMHTRLAEAVPATLAAAIESDLVKPLSAWITAHDSAKERMRHLEGRRLEYDAARRRLEAAADKAATAEAGGARDPAGAERRLGRTEGEVEPLMVEFEAERAALAEHLTWMVTAAARLKAYVADTAIAMRNAATSYTVPEGLLEPYPETARGEQVAGAPQGPSQQSAATHTAGEAAPVNVHTDIPETVQLEGGVKPQGRGVGGLLADTFKSAVGLPTGPGGSVRPHVEKEAAQAPATGGAEGVSGAALDASALAPTEVVVAESVVHMVEPPVTEAVLHVVDVPPAQGARAEGAPRGGSAGVYEGEDAPYVEDVRDPRPYASDEPGGPVSPRRECRMPDTAAHGLGLRGRALSRDLPPDAGGADQEPEPAIEDAEAKQLSAVVAPGSPLAAGLAGKAAQAGAEGEPAGGDDVVRGDTTRSGGGGLMGAIKAATMGAVKGITGQGEGARGEAAAAPSGDGEGKDGLFSPTAQLGSTS